MVSEPRFPVTPEYVAETREQIARDCPDWSASLVEHALAQDVAINVFGPEWWARGLAADQPDPFFVRGAEDSHERRLYQHRALVFGRDLLICQHFPGFDERRAEFRTRSLAAVYHELRVARLLYDGGHRIAFVVPTGVTGEDYDLEVDEIVATEAKAKGDSTAYTRSTLRTSLETARRQLPAAGPGLIALRIPEAWPSDPLLASEGTDVIENFLRTTGRVNAVVVLWEEWHEFDGDAAACATVFRVFESASPRTELDGLRELMRALSPETVVGPARLA